MLWIIFFVFAVIIMTIELILSAKRSFFVNMIRAASHVLTVAVSFVLAKVISPAVVMRIWEIDAISGSISDPLTYSQATELVSKNSGIAAAAVAPIIFFVLWLLIGIIFYIIYKITAVSCGYKFPKEKDVRGKYIASMCTGFLMALMIIFTFWMAPAGYTATVLDSAAAIEAVENEYDIDKSTEEISGAKSQFNMLLFSNKFSSFLFRGLTSFKSDGERASVCRELPDTVSSLYALSYELKSVDINIENITDSKKSESICKTFYLIADASEKSLTERSIFASFFKGFANSLKAGEKSYLGIEMNLDAEDYIQVLFDDFHDTTPRTFPTDMRKFAGTIRTVFNAGDIISAASSEEGHVEKEELNKFFIEIEPESADTVSEMIDILAENLQQGSEDLDAVMLLRDVYTDMAKAKADEAFSDKEYKEEADAATEILFLICGGNANTKEMLDAYSKSDIVSSAISKAVKNGSIGIITFSQEEIDGLTDDFEKYIAENGASEKINDLAMLFGVIISE